MSNLKSQNLSIIIKNLIFFLRPHILLGWISSFCLQLAYFLQVSKWIKIQNKTLQFNDFFTFKRQYNKREKLYEYVLKSQHLENEIIDYFEFGVASGNSFKWWLKRLSNNENKFYGFDTFEGLPENWGNYFKKGDMLSNIPDVMDNRVFFYKGLFQDTLLEFLKNNHIGKERRKIIHLDADLFSATLFVLTTLFPYLKAGDILFFDEFNVPKHEFLAFKIFTESFYVKYETLGAVNNYYQVAFMLK